MSAVLDASAMLAFMQGEEGAEAVDAALSDEPCCSAANWSEVAQRIIASDGDWDLARALLLSYDIRVEPVTAEDAEWAAHRYRHGEGLSLADRLCMALGERLEMPVLTADTAWGSEGRVIQIR